MLTMGYCRTQPSRKSIILEGVRLSLSFLSAYLPFL